jgi:hypothetical protein
MVIRKKCQTELVNVVLNLMKIKPLYTERMAENSGFYE